MPGQWRSPPERDWPPPTPANPPTNPAKPPAAKSQDQNPILRRRWSRSCMALFFGHDVEFRYCHLNPTSRAGCGKLLNRRPDGRSHLIILAGLRIWREESSLSAVLVAVTRTAGVVGRNPKARPDNDNIPSRTQDVLSTGASRLAWRSRPLLANSTPQGAAKRLRSLKTEKTSRGFLVVVLPFLSVLRLFAALKTAELPWKRLERPRTCSSQGTTTTLWPHSHFVFIPFVSSSVKNRFGRLLSPSDRRRHRAQGKHPSHYAWASLPLPPPLPPCAAHKAASPAGGSPAMVNDDEPYSHNRRGFRATGTTQARS